MTDDDRKYVLFLDSLGDDDIEKMPWTRENLVTQGSMDCRPVYVTPTVLGSVYTGKRPTDHGLTSISRYEGEARGRPDAPTIPEIAAASEKYETVVQMGLPFIVPPDVDANGDYFHHSGAFGQSVTLPQGFENRITTPNPPGDLDKPDEDFDHAFDARVDYTDEAFARMRNFSVQSEADVVFFGYRILDAYTHYKREEDYRDRLLEEVDRQIKYTANLGDVFVFGDHGSMEMDELFRLNRWLLSEGFLDVHIDYRWIEKAREYGELEDDDATPGEMFTDRSPGVTVNGEESVAIAADPFSTGITLLDGADEDGVNRLIAELEAQNAFEAVHWSGELWGDGKHLTDTPDLYAERRPGVFVSGNLHPEAGGVEVTRSGVHHPYGGYGATNDAAFDTETTPEGLFHIITEDFLGLDPEGVEQSGDADHTVDGDVEDHLKDLGYI